MTMHKVQEREKTWLEKLEEFLTDEFHHGLYEVITKTHWIDVQTGAWQDPLNFFRCLDSEHEYLITNPTKPLQVESRLRDLNYSGQMTVMGEERRFLESQLLCNRQKILLLHSLRLILENKDQELVNLDLIVPIIRREIHQCIRLVFFYWKSSLQRKELQDFIDDLDQYGWLQINDVHRYLTDYLISWLEQQGVERSDVGDLRKLGRLNRTLNKYISYHPQLDAPVDFRYEHVFTDRQNVGFFSLLFNEIDRLGSLMYLEGLSHIPSLTLNKAKAISQAERPNLGIEATKSKTDKRGKGGTQYQNQLAVHYLLLYTRANTHNTKKAKFSSFLTGYGEEGFRRQWSNIHGKSDESGQIWEKDMKIVRSYFEELGLTEVVKLIDNDLDSISGKL
jgi:hypothetical protein